MGLQIEQPLYLLLIIPAIIVLSFYWKKNQVTAPFEKYTILSLRSIIILLIIIALAIPYVQTPIKGVTTVFVVDHSESVINKENTMYETIDQAVRTMDIDDQYAIVTVAEEAEVAQSLSNREEGIIASNVIEDTAFTNLEDGLQLASSLLPANSKGRIVLLTDGNENIGDVQQQVELLNQQQIAVDVIPFTTNINNDVAVENFTVPAHLYVGEQANLSVTLNSTMDTSSRILISNNNETIVDEEVQINQGRNQYTFNYLIQSTGNQHFQVEIVAEQDEQLQNNIAYAVTDVQGPPSVLLVEEIEGEGENIKAALEAANLPVTTISPALLPTTLAGVLDYESIIFTNVAATEVTAEQMEVIESAVKDFGVGFIMTGGNRSYGLGGYFQTPIERILPVEMDLKGKKELPSLGMVFVIDRSGSMSGYKMNLAKEAAARSVELLRENDTLGLIAFDDQPWQIIETGPLNDKEDAIDKIRSIQVGGGTEIFSSLELAYSQLESLELQRKHIILLTDGQSATNGDYSTLITNGLENNITLSTVAIGNDADRILLEELATEATGRFYDVADASTIPSILSRETILTTRTYIEDEPFYPTHVEGTNWSSMFACGVPQMNAYIATDPKSRAEQVLISEKDDPVLIRWQYGLGNTVAWTSDVKGEWAGEWPLWDNWSTLWNDVVSWSLPSYQNDAYDIQQSVNGREVTLTISSVNPDLLPLEAHVVNEKGQEIPSEIRVTAPGEHEVTFQATTGVYYLQLNKLEDEKVISTFQTGIAVPYSKEFELIEQNQSLLEEIIDVGNGKIIESPEEAFRPVEGEHYERQAISSPFILFAFLLFFIEIAVRRFGLVAVWNKVQDLRKNRTENKQQKQKNINTTYERLKTATTKTSKTSIVKDKKPERKAVSKRPITKSKREKEPTIRPKQVAPTEKTSTERMKRLLDAKNRNRR